MKIAVNARFLIENKLEGIGIFTYEVLRRMVENHPEHHFIIFYDRRPPNWFKGYSNVTEEVLSPPARHPVLWYFFFEFGVYGALRRHVPDVFLSMDGYLPLRTPVPSIPVIHDLAFEHYPEDVPWLVSKYYRYFFPKFALIADRIATVSRFSKKDISERYNVEMERIDVVYNGAGEKLKPCSEEEVDKVRRALTGGQPYFIYIGALHRRKNIARLLNAFDKFKADTGLPHKLVLAGRKAWKRTEMEETYNKMDYAGDVVFTGWLPQDTLYQYLGAAESLCYISYFEGFGIPVLEAMYCDVPVLTSTAASLPEVAGDAALLADPVDVNDIAVKMKTMASDENLRSELIAKGKEQRKKFSWDKTEAKLWKTIEKTYKPAES